MNAPTRFFCLSYQPPQFSRAVAAGAVLPVGNLVATDSDGNAVLASDTAGLTICGIASGVPGESVNAKVRVDNTGGAAGEKHIYIRTGVYQLLNSKAAPVTAEELGKPVFVESETTVAKTTTHSIAAGILFGLDGVGKWMDRVWVLVIAPGQLPGSVSLFDK